MESLKNDFAKSNFSQTHANRPIMLVNRTLSMINPKILRKVSQCASSYATQLSFVAAVASSIEDGARGKDTVE